MLKLLKFIIAVINAEQGCFKPQKTHRDKPQESGKEISPHKHDPEKLTETTKICHQDKAYLSLFLEHNRKH